MLDASPRRPEGTFAMSSPLRVRPLLVFSTLIALVGCGRSELDLGELPDGSVAVDVPLDRSDTPVDARCFANLDCDDGVFCNGAEACSAGRCVAGAPINCDDGQGCTVDTCSEAARSCANTPDDARCPAPGRCDVMRGCVTGGCTSDAQCDDRDVCNGVEVCQAGRCVQSPAQRCDDGVPCTTDLCDPAAGCVFRPDNARCDNGRFCDGAEQCVVGRGCAPGRPVLCDDGNACTAERCDDTTRSCVSSSTPLDGDGDGFVSARCGGDDCDDNDRTVNPRAVELCGDGRDNNCDGLADCRDRVCARTPACGACVPTGPEAGAACADGRDNDCDGITDCADTDCRTAPSCQVCVPTGPESNEMTCGDGRDNDCDGATDCADRGCAMVPRCVACVPTGPELCGDGRDNDCNGATDCADPLCARTDLCAGVPNDSCSTATVIGLPGRAVGTTTGARNELEPTCANPGGLDVVFVLRNPVRQTITIDTEGSSFDTVLQVYRDRCGDPASAIACDDDSGSGVTSRVVIPNAPPGTYFIVLDGFGGSNGPFVLNARVSAVEVCDNGVDDDGDALADCRDPDCATFPRCQMCVPTGPELGAACADRVDNDCDGLTDCASPACAMAPNCLTPVPNDRCDGAIPITVPSRTTGTTQGATNDFTPQLGQPGCAGGAGPDVVYALRVTRATTVTIDTLGSTFDTVLFVRRADCDAGPQVACNDDTMGLQSRVTFAVTPGVYYVFLDGFGGSSMGNFVMTVSESSAVEVCDNRVDDDGDGLVDCADRDCASSIFCACTPAPERDNAACSDRRDNDCDGQSDCADPDCATTAVCCRPTASRELGVGQCSDGIDNDCDGVADCADSDCRPSQSPGSECCNGRDDNGNSLIDEFACGCESAANCRGVGNGGPFPSNTCWSTTFRVCAPSCNLLGGNAFCNNFFPGTRCDNASGECR